MKFYFITFQAENKQGSVSIWNDVTNKSPMEFIKHLISVEERGSNTYHNFVVINTCEISLDEFVRYNGHF